MPQPELVGAALAQHVLLEFNLLAHKEREEIQEATDAGLSDSRILSLYPFDYTAYEQYLAEWLASPPRIVIEAPMPDKPRALSAGRDLIGLVESWNAYVWSDGYLRHAEIATGSLGLWKATNDFLQAMHDVLWILSNFPDANERCKVVADVYDFNEYLSSWLNRLMRQDRMMPFVGLDRHFSQG